MFSKSGELHPLILSPSSVFVSCGIQSLTTTGLHGLQGKRARQGAAACARGLLNTGLNKAAWNQQFDVQVEHRLSATFENDVKRRAESEARMSKRQEELLASIRQVCISINRCNFFRIGFIFFARWRVRIRSD
jgi:hypothetical protein